jgi:hypothetical protein
MMLRVERMKKMAIVIDLDARRMTSARQKHLPAEGARILIFNGVRFERLEGPQPVEEAAPGEDGSELRNKAV